MRFLSACPAFVIFYSRLCLFVFCHCSRPLQDGDIISVDVSVSVRDKYYLHLHNITWNLGKRNFYITTGYFPFNYLIIFQVYIGGVHGDLCETYVVGCADAQAHRLLESCQRCLDAAINICSPGTRFSWIGSTIRYVIIHCSHYLSSHWLRAYS